MSTTLTPTAATGATTKASDIVYVEPARRVDDAELGQSLGAVGLNGPFILDLLSS